MHRCVVVSRVCESRDGLILDVPVWRYKQSMSEIHKLTLPRSLMYMYCICIDLDGTSNFEAPHGTSNFDVPLLCILRV